MDFIAHILTGWTGDGITIPYHPTLADDYLLQSWGDITGQDVSQIIPDVNLFVVEVKCSQSVLEAIELDAKYEVIWFEEQTE